MELDIIPRYFTSIELHVSDAERTLPKAFGALIKRGGGRYSELRSCSSATRYVTIKLVDPGALALVEQILAQYVTATVILRDARGIQAGDKRLYAMTYAPHRHADHSGHADYMGAPVKIDDIVIRKGSGPGGRFTDLQSVARHVAALEARCAPVRMHNAITQGIHGADRACRQFAASLCEHLRLCAATRTALSVALDRIELRVLKGEPIV